MLTLLFGAMVLGFFVLAGGWFGLRWTRAHEARGVDAALLAEMTVAQNHKTDGVDALGPPPRL
jgi:hypothetical protein